MDDLFLEVFRRRAEQGLARFAEFVASGPTLRHLWEQGDDDSGAPFNIEFIALANHRKAVRAEMASYAERFRAMQLDAVARALARAGVPAVEVAPEAVLLAMIGTSQVMALEATLDVDTGHAETRTYVARLLDGLDARAAHSPRRLRRR
jgi:hypothetical protein